MSTHELTGTTELQGQRALRPILFVDDEEHNLTVFEAAFDDDYQVYTADSAPDALKLLAEHEIHVVITDQRMPGMTGVQLLQELVDNYPQAVRIVLTAYSDIEVVIQAINVGRVYQYVTKPWDEDDFKIIIDHALEDYDLRQSNERLLAELNQKAAREGEIRRAFQRYVPAAVVDDILDPGASDSFEGEHRDVVLLYSQILDFAGLTANLEPKKVVTFLNGYSRLMYGIVVRHLGTVRDSMLAVFGAPVAVPDSVEAAVDAALEMVEALEEFNREEAVPLLGQEIRVGIGIHRGEVVAGSIGSNEKREYMVIGDPVNTVARIQELTHRLPDSILLSERIYRQAAHLVEAEATEPIQLRGRSETTQLYRVLGRRDA